MHYGRMGVYITTDGCTDMGGRGQCLFSMIYSTYNCDYFFSAGCKQIEIVGGNSIICIARSHSY